MYQIKSYDETGKKVYSITLQYPGRNVTVLFDRITEEDDAVSILEVCNESGHTNPHFQKLVQLRTALKHFAKQTIDEKNSRHIMTLIRICTELLEESATQDQLNKMEANIKEWVTDHFKRQTDGPW